MLDEGIEQCPRQPELHHERARLHVLLEGYMSIQAGSRARVIDERLKTMVPEWSLPADEAA